MLEPLGEACSEPRVGVRGAHFEGPRLTVATGALDGVDEPAFERLGGGVGFGGRFEGGPPARRPRGEPRAGTEKNGEERCDTQERHDRGVTTHGPEMDAGFRSDRCALFLAGCGERGGEGRFDGIAGMAERVLHGRYRRTMTVSFCPPKPKPLLMATSTPPLVRRSRAALAT